MRSLALDYGLTNFCFLHYKGIQRREMFQLARNAVNFIFAGNKVKQELEQVFDLAAKTLEF